MSGWPNPPENGEQTLPGTAVVPYVEPLPPPPAKERRYRLGSIGEVRKQMAEVYREVRNGKIELREATAYTYILRELAALIRDHDLETRIEALENGREQ